MSFYSKEDFFGSGVPSFDLKKYLQKLLGKWWYFGISIPIVLILAIVFIYISAPVYNVGTTILVKTENESRLLGETNEQGGIKLFNKNQNLQNEIEILKSFSLSRQVVEKLDLTISYYREKNYKVREEYKSSPYIVIADPTEYQMIGQPIQIEISSKDTYNVKIKSEGGEYTLYRSETDSGDEYEGKVEYSGQCNFGESCVSEYFKFTVNLIDPQALDDPDLSKTKRYFYINTLDGMAEALMGGLKVLIPVDKATTLNISTKSAAPEMAVDYLNELIQTYQVNKLREKNEYAEGTIQFISDQLNSVTDSLKGAESQLSGIRRRNSTLNIGETARASEQRLNTLEDERDRMNLANQYYKKLLTDVSSEDNINKIVTPSTMGISDPVLTQLILDLKELSSKKVSSGFGATSSIEAQRIEKNIDNTQQMIIENVRGLLSSSEISLTNLRQRIGRVRGELSLLPESERNLVQVQRKFNLNDQLYTFLQQKRAEAEIAKAANTPDSQILDSARILGGGPVAPNKPLILAMAFMLGLVIPILIIYVQDAMNDKVMEVEQIQSRTNVSVLSTIPAGKKPRDFIESMEPASLEAFRFLQLKISQVSGPLDNKVIGVTSYIPKEGKDYTSTNLARAMAFSGLKTILIDADIRKPNLHKGFMANNHPGLTSYLVYSSKANELIIPDVANNLDLIPAGPIPGNFAEIVSGERLEELFDFLRERYDMIIVNTPPIGVVSDYLIMGPKIDLTLFVVRQSYSEIANIKEIDKFVNITRLKNIFVVFNGVESERKKMKKYGYYYQNHSNNGNGQAAKFLKSKKGNRRKKRQLSI